MCLTRRCPARSTSAHTGCGVEPGPDETPSKFDTSLPFYSPFLILDRVLRMRLKQAYRTEFPVRLLEPLGRVHRQSAATPGGHVVHGVTKLAAEQKVLFAAIGVSTSKPQEPAEPASTAALW